MAGYLQSNIDAPHLLGFRSFMTLDSPHDIQYLNKVLHELVTAVNTLLKSAGGNLQQMVTLGIIYCFEFTGDGVTKEWEITGVILEGSNPIAMLNGVSQSEANGHFSWSTPTPSASRIAFAQAPRNGAKGQVFYVGTKNP